MSHKRRCVFCGKPPEGKTLEHVIPRWLIEATGDPGREARFGPIWDSKTQTLGTKVFSFDSLRFPSCDRCNATYSTLENQARGAFQKLLRRRLLSDDEADNLLAWMDKVRIGMWLGVHQWRGAATEIEPHMAITSRINMTDRCLFVYRSKSRSKGLRLYGFEMPAFHYTPCCCSIAANGIGIFNLSGDYLLSKRLGLPYPKRASFLSWPAAAYDIVPGKNTVTLPLITKAFDTRCTQYYQPIAARATQLLADHQYYSNPYARALLRDMSTGIGKVLVASSGDRAVRGTDSADMADDTSLIEDLEMHRLLFTQTIQFQLYMHNRGLPERSIPEPHRTIAKMQRQFAHEFARNSISQVQKIDRSGST